MHALVVVAHPDPASFTHAVATALVQGVTDGTSGHSADIADLVQEGFDPRFTTADLAAFRNQARYPADVLAEQQRLDRTDALVLVYPVYWWSFPGLLKGWIDRVFTKDWAYDDAPDAAIPKKLGRLPVHLVAIGAADQRTYTRRGYTDAMKTQIDLGIFDYVGAPVHTSTLLLTPEDGFPDTHLAKARQIGSGLFE